MSDRRTGGGGTKLSPQTLIVASLASVTAAIVTSTFWQRGTPITAALTPVIVALASELYSRPARRITELSSRAATTRNRRFVHDSERERERDQVRAGGGPPERPRPDALRPPDEPELGPVRVYRTEQSSSPIRRVHIRLALITAAIAFVIAAAVLTLPELVFGGSVASHGKTTFFGGRSHRHKSSTSGQHKTSTQTSPTTSAPTPTTTAPSSSTTTPTAPPAQTAPQTTTPTQTPAPSSGTPVAPPAQAPTTTPAPTP
ncbi:MAG TPA: hypothetical protein VGI67_10585 [Thermoleophilaceae bacterium]